MNNNLVKYLKSGQLNYASNYLKDLPKKDVDPALCLTTMKLLIYFLKQQSTKLNSLCFDDVYSITQYCSLKYFKSDIHDSDCEMIKYLFYVCEIFCKKDLIKFALGVIQPILCSCTLKRLRIIFEYFFSFIQMKGTYYRYKFILKHFGIMRQVYKENQSIADALVCFIYVLNKKFSTANEDAYLAIQELAKIDRQFHLSYDGTVVMIKLVYYYFGKSESLSSLIDFLTPYKDSRCLSKLKGVVCLFHSINNSSISSFDNVDDLLSQEKECDEFYFTFSNILLKIGEIIRDRINVDVSVVPFVKFCLKYFEGTSENLKDHIKDSFYLSCLTGSLYGGACAVLFIKDENDLIKLRPDVTKMVDYLFSLPLNASISHIKSFVHLMAITINHTFPKENCSLTFEVSFKFLSLVAVHIHKDNREPIKEKVQGMSLRFIKNSTSVVQGELSLITVLMLTHSGFMTKKWFSKLWCSVKSMHPILAPLTVESLFNKYSEETKAYWPYNALPELNIGKFLLEEMVGYSKYSCPKLSAVSGCYLSCQSCIQDPWLLAKALIIAIYSLSGVIEHEHNIKEIMKSFQKSVLQMEKSKIAREKTGKSLLLQGCLKYCHALYYLSNINLDSLSAIERYGSSKNGTENSEVHCVYELLVSSCVNVKYDGLHIVNQYCQESLSLWQSALNKDGGNDQVFLLLSLSLMKSLGYFYRLQKRRKDEISVWSLMSSFSKMNSLDKFFIIGVAELLDCSSSVDLALIDRANHLLKTTHSYENTYFKETFYMNLVKYEVLYQKKKPEDHNSVIDKVNCKVSTITEIRFNLVKLLLEKDFIDQKPFLMSAFSLAQVVASDHNLRNLCMMCLTYSLYLEVSVLFGMFHLCSLDLSPVLCVTSIVNLKKTINLSCFYWTCDMLLLRVESLLLTVNMEAAHSLLTSIEFLLDLRTSGEDKLCEDNICSKLYAVDCQCNYCTDPQFVGEFLGYLTCKGYYWLLKDNLGNATFIMHNAFSLCEKLKKLVKNFQFCDEWAKVIKYYYFTSKILFRLNKSEKFSRYMKLCEKYCKHHMFHSWFLGLINHEKLKAIAFHVTSTYEITPISSIPEVKHVQSETICKTPTNEVSLENFSDAPVKEAFVVQFPYTPNVVHVSLFSTESGKPTTSNGNNASANPEQDVCEAGSVKSVLPQEAAEEKIASTEINEAIVKAPLVNNCRKKYIRKKPCKLK